MKADNLLPGQLLNLLLPTAGDVPVAILHPEISVQNVDPKSRKQMVGPVPAELSIKENSVITAEQKNQPVYLYTVVTNVDGNQKLRNILQNSVRNVEILLPMKTLPINFCRTLQKGGVYHA